MDKHDDLLKVAKLLDSEPRLHGCFNADPQVIWIPFADDPGKRWMFVGLFLVEELLKRDEVTSVCTRTLEVLNANKALAKADGLEIMLCVARGGTAERVLRLQVLAKAFTSAELLTPAEIGARHPMDGVTSALYRRTLS